MEPQPYTYRVTEVVNVTDGDTVDVRLDLGFAISVRKRVRLAGINAPESRTTDRVEKVLGIEAKEWLRAALEGAALLVSTDKPDRTEKYGRVLGRLFVVGHAESLNDRMVREGYALPYSGQGPRMNVRDLVQARGRYASRGQSRSPYALANAPQETVADASAGAEAGAGTGAGTGAGAGAEDKGEAEGSTETQARVGTEAVAQLPGPTHTVCANDLHTATPGRPRPRPARKAKR
jgi:micrococcal nuclease